MDPSEITACIPTRGNVDMTEIRESLDGFGEVIIWDNNDRDVDLSVYGRYAAIAEAQLAVVYTQDDDCLVDAARVCRSYMPHTLIANMPAPRWPDYPDSALVGWGAVFDRGLPARAFDRLGDYCHDRQIKVETFWDTCDVAFSTLTPHIKIDVGFAHLPWAEGPGRMFTDDYPTHRRERDEMLALARRVRDST